MNKSDTVTVIKSGNSYALRIPKAYAVNNDLKVGQKVRLSPPIKILSKTNHKKLRQMILEIQELSLYNKIKDPVAWQKQQRERSNQANRDY